MRLTSISSLILATTLLASPVVWSADPVGASTKTMAEIMMSVRHYPSDADKEILKKISADAASSAYEKTIATAILNLNHAAADADKAKLDAITKDAAAPEQIKVLAGIVLNLNHKPSEADTAKLKQVAGK